VIVETHNSLASPQRLSASRVVIYHDDGTPLCVAVVCLTGYQILRAGERGFKEALHVLGIDRTVIVEEMPAPMKGTGRPFNLDSVSDR
jgi:hypothetical protein